MNGGHRTPLCPPKKPRPQSRAHRPHRPPILWLSFLVPHEGPHLDLHGPHNGAVHLRQQQLPFAGQRLDLLRVRPLKPVLPHSCQEEGGLRTPQRTSAERNVARPTRAFGIVRRGVCPPARSAGLARGRGGGGVGHKASVSGCLPLAAPIGLSPLLILTLCGPERVLVVSTEPPDDLSCLTTPGVGRPGDGLLPVPLTRGISMHPPSPCGGLPTPAPTCARWGVHLQDHVPDGGF